MKKLVVLLLVLGTLTFGAGYAATMALAGQGGSCCGQCEIPGGDGCTTCKR